jgi:CubicO group peptidase (beta-lactamase class C family)
MRSSVSRLSKVLYLAVVCSALHPAAVLAQATPEPDLAARLAAIEKTVDRKRRQLHVPGAALVIVKDDKVIYQKGLGYRDMAERLPVTLDTLFAIGSTTKAFTAMAMMICADEGKLALDDSPKKYLPEFKLQDPETDAKITLGDLLSHRSGLTRTDIAWYTGRLSAREVIRLVGTVKPTAKLGEKFQYQNVMYLVAGEVLARVEKRSWDQVIARRIFRPLGMSASNTTIRAMQRAPDFALGYSYDTTKKDWTRLPMRDLRNIAPAGAINSNVRDMAQWLRLMLGGGVFEGKRLVSEKSFRELTVKRIEIGKTMGYGYGWMLGEWEGHPIWEHSGGIDGFNAHVALMPNQKLGLCLLTNISSSSLPSIATNAVWENLVGRAPKPEMPLVEIAADAPAVEPASEAGTYHLAEAKVDVVVTWEGGKLMLQAPGQPKLVLENVSGRRYKIGPPAPEGFFITFRPGKEDAKETEAFLEQGSVTFVLRKQKPAPFTAPLTVEELMQKVIVAAGGEANLRKHKTMRLRYTISVPTQGLTGRGVTYARAPNAQAESVTLTGLEKTILTQRGAFDGRRAWAASSLGPPMELSGDPLANAALAADFTPALNWKTLFKTVTIERMEKVGDEEGYVVVKTPEKGNPITDTISTKTFLLLKRVTRVPIPALNTTVSVDETFGDYRPVDGVMIPFRRTREMPMAGEMILTVTEARFDVRLPKAAFNGMITSDKFCLSQSVRLNLHHWRRPLRLR